jgi:hypothetical protein
VNGPQLIPWGPFSFFWARDDRIAEELPPQ